MTRNERLLILLALVTGLGVLAAHAIESVQAQPWPDLSKLSYPSKTMPMLAAEPDFANAKRATLRLEHDKGVCSATAIEDSDPMPGSHRVLTAAHCVEVAALAQFGLHVADPDKLNSLRLGLRSAKVLAVEFDGSDGAILTTDIYFTDVAKFGPKPKQGDVVFAHGNPAGVPNILVVGRVAGWVDDYDVNGVMVIDFNAWYGCSGAAVFDSEGRIVGVVNALWPWPQKGWRMTASFPLGFDEAAITRN